MSFFSIGENYLEFQNGNEVVRIIAWGTNSLRVVSAPSGELDLSCCALFKHKILRPRLRLRGM